MPPAHSLWSQCRSQTKKPWGAKAQREREKSGTCSYEADSVVSPYKVINSTSLAHIHSVVEVPAGEKKHVKL